MDELNPETKRLFAAKEARRQRLARAPFPEKIAALIRLQELAAPIQRQRGRMVTPWRLPFGEGTLLLNEESPDYGTPKPKD